jgi:hypothetical protein
VFRPYASTVTFPWLVNNMPSVHYSESISVIPAPLRRRDSPVPECLRLAAQGDYTLPEVPVLALPRSIFVAPRPQRLQPLTPLLLPSTLELQAVEPPTFDDDDEDYDEAVTVIEPLEATAWCFGCGQHRPLECLVKRSYKAFGVQPACDLCVGHTINPPASAHRFILNSLQPKALLKLDS